MKHPIFILENNRNRSQFRFCLQWGCSVYTFATLTEDIARPATRHFLTLGYSILHILAKFGAHICQLLGTEGGYRIRHVYRNKAGNKFNSIRDRHSDNDLAKPEVVTSSSLDVIIFENWQMLTSSNNGKICVAGQYSNTSKIFQMSVNLIRRRQQLSHNV